MYHNYKGYSSVILMAVADTNYRFVYVNIWSYGKDCHSSIFEWSSLKTSVIINNPEIPTETNVTGIESHIITRLITLLETKYSRLFTSPL